MRVRVGVGREDELSDVLSWREGLVWDEVVELEE